MLFTVQGGGFFSSSASGYSKGFSLLLLGQKSEDQPMIVAPWNQYQLVDQETNPDKQLASDKKRLVRRCASLVCFGRSSTGLESSSPLKVGLTQHQKVSSKVASPDKERDQTYSLDLVNQENIIKKVSIKSSLRKPKNSIPVSCASDEDHEVSCDKDGDSGWKTEKRKVQWVDAHGGELVDIREFEPSDDGRSDDEFDLGTQKVCECTIM